MSKRLPSHTPYQKSEPVKSWHYNGQPMPGWVKERFSQRAGRKLSMFHRGNVIEAYPGDTIVSRAGGHFHVEKGTK